MIRQLGLPTWFMSLSAAETRWIDLLRTLGNLLEKNQYSDEEILNFDWTKKSDLIKSDPVTCVRFFDHRIHTFIHNVLLSPHNPIGKVRDYFYRVEFQQREVLIFICLLGLMVLHN
jgi:hypothetical protein